MGRYIRPALLTIDWLLFNAAFALALYLFRDTDAATDHSHWLWLAVNLSVLPVAINESRRNFSSLRAIQLDRTVLHALAGVGMHALFFLSFLAFFGFDGLTRKFIVTYYGLAAAGIVVWALISRKFIKSYRRRGYNFTRVVIIGTNSTARRLYEEMVNDPGYGYKVLGFFDHEWRADFAGRYCGTLDHLDSFVKNNKIDQIYFTLPGHDSVLTQVVKIADDNVAEFFYVPQISRYINRGFQVVNIGAMPVLTVRNNPLKRTVNQALKRAFDILASGMFLCFYPLIYIPIAIGIKLTSPGPVYFVQTRTGYRGKDFGCLKFRTMHVNKQADAAQATKDDPRKTRFGDFLRRTSLDELPQFINVFKGDMSIVGPRPHMLRHTEEYSKLIDQYMVRHLVKPGITGWAQVNGYRGQTDELWKMEKRVEYDVWYIEHWTFLLDLRIVAHTALNMIHGEENAY